MTFSRRSTEYVFGIILKMSVFFIVAHIHDLAIAFIHIKNIILELHIIFLKSKKLSIS